LGGFDQYSVRRSAVNTCVDYATDVLQAYRGLTSQELKRWLTEQGCTFEAGRGGHLIIRLGDKITDLPMHGKKKDLPTGTVNAIKKRSA
jgi:mRNA interferase HicA